jgi:hypothetical protein
MHEELPNGGAKWWLAGGEQSGVLTLAEGKKWRRGKNLWPLSPFIGEGERERGEHGPAHWRRTADVLLVQRKCGTVPLSYRDQTHVQCGSFEADLAHYSTGPGPIH